MKTIPSIVRSTLRQCGYDADACCIGGRCYEFADWLYENLVEAGYEPFKTSSPAWVRGDWRKFQQPPGYAEEKNLYGNPHAWVVVDGKHYDALNPEGMYYPGCLQYFLDTLSLHHFPEDEEQFYQWSTKQKIYDPALDAWVRIPGNHPLEYVDQDDLYEQWMEGC